MTLNVKNVKGYEKMPYCHVHYPQPKPTVVVDNPEMQRIRLLTDIHLALCSTIPIIPACRQLC
jgi:hypothetical protein